MQPIHATLPVNGIELSYFEWAGNKGNGPTLVFSHATGFHARVFDAIVERFAGYRVISIDLRGHGRSTGGPITHWNEVSSDVDALIDHLSIEQTVGIGHSMGAHTLLQCSLDRPSAFRQLVLFDPVVVTPEFYAHPDPLFTPDNPHPASRRKRDFASPKAMIERFKDRDPYQLFDRRVFEDYCRFGLLEGENGFDLACLPEIEASVYSSSRSNAGILEVATKVPIPVLIVRAQQSNFNDFKSSPTWPELASTMPNGTDMHRPDRTHFHPLEDPADAARIVADAMANYG